MSSGFHARINGIKTSTLRMEGFRKKIEMDFYSYQRSSSAVRARSNSSHGNQDIGYSTSALCRIPML